MLHVLADRLRAAVGDLPRQHRKLVRCLFGVSQVPVTHLADLLVLFPQQPEHEAADEVNGYQMRPQPAKVGTLLIARAVTLLPRQEVLHIPSAQPKYKHADRLICNKTGPQLVHPRLAFASDDFLMLSEVMVFWPAKKLPVALCQDD